MIENEEVQEESKEKRKRKRKKKKKKQKWKKKEEKNEVKNEVAQQDPRWNHERYFMKKFKQERLQKNCWNENIVFGLFFLSLSTLGASR